jgi:hypothetical protein
MVVKEHYFEARVSKEFSSTEPEDSAGVFYLPVANKVHSMKETAFPLADVKN